MTRLKYFDTFEVVFTISKYGSYFLKVKNIFTLCPKYFYINYDIFICDINVSFQLRPFHSTIYTRPPQKIIKTNK